MAERKETRPGYVRVTIDLPTPLYDRLRSYVEELKALYGASEQAVCRRFIDEGLARAGHPEAGEGAPTAKPNKKH